MMFRTLTILFLLLISLSALAKIILNASIVYKKGIDKGLVLINEYHSVEELDNFGMASLKIKNELEIILTASFINDNTVYGPSNLIKIDGQLFLREQKITDSFFNKEILITLGASQTFVYQNNTGHLVELTITPDVR